MLQVSTINNCILYSKKEEKQQLYYKRSLLHNLLNAIISLKLNK